MRALARASASFSPDQCECFNNLDMRKRKWVLVGAGILAFCVGVALVASSLTRQVPMQTWELSDHSTLKLMGITWGTKHRVSWSVRLRDHFYPVLPAWLRAKFDVQPTAISIGAPGGMVVWMEKSEFRGGARYIAEDAFVTVVDDQGVENSMARPVVRNYVGGGFGPTTQSCGIAISELPRRSKAVRVRIYTSTATCPLPPPKLLAEFSLPNLLQRSSANWEAERLPAVRQSKGLEVTLRAVETGLPIGAAVTNKSVQATMDFNKSIWVCIAVGRGLSGLSGLPWLSRAVFDFREGGQPTTNWNVARLVFSTSNCERREVVPLSGFPEVVFQGGLWLDEPA